MYKLLHLQLVENLEVVSIFLELMKPPHWTNSLPIAKDQLFEQALASNQPMVALLIDDTVRYLRTVNQYSGKMISDIGHMLVSGSDTLVPEYWFTVSE